MQNIVLIGFMGSGKTTVGKALAEKLQMDFVDTDALIEAQEGKSIASIFETQGEAKFRGLEHNLLEESDFSNAVVSTGGGMPCHFNNMDQLNKIGTTVYLKVNSEELTQRLIGNSANRPKMLAGTKEESKKRVDELLQQREVYYSKANFTIENEGKRMEEVVANIINFCQ